MKNHTASNSLFLSIAFFSVFATSLSAQQNAIKVTPLKPVFGGFQLQYERTVAPKTSLVFEQNWVNSKREKSGGFMYLGFVSSNTEDIRVKGFSTDMMLRRYSKSAMNGLFMEGGLRYHKYRVSTTKNVETFNPYAIFTLNLDQVATSEKAYSEATYQGLAVKAGAGYQKTFGHFSLECSGGLTLGNHLPQKAALYTRLAMGVNF